MSRAKIRDFVDEYRDTYGATPDHKVIAKNTKVPLVDAKSYMMESAAINTESSFDNIGGAKNRMSGHTILHSLPEDLKDIGMDIYGNNLKESDITKKYKIGRTTYFSKKKKIDGFLKQNSGLANIEYR
jgi:DNA-directed RNA polymerase specialized sigma subunit